MKYRERRGWVEGHVVDISFWKHGNNSFVLSCVKQITNDKIDDKRGSFEAHKLQPNKDITTRLITIRYNI